MQQLNDIFVVNDLHHSPFCICILPIIFVQDDRLSDIFGSFWLTLSNDFQYCAGISSINCKQCPKFSQKGEVFFLFFVRIRRIYFLLFFHAIISKNNFLLTMVKCITFKIFYKRVHFILVVFFVYKVLEFI